MGILAAALAKHKIVNDTTQEVTQFLSTGYLPLDYRISGKYIGGGIPVGRITEISGPPSAGKTAISTNIMIAAQQQGGVAIFMDHEKSFDIGLATSLGLNDDPDSWVYKRPLTYEESWDQVKEILGIIRGITFDKEGRPVQGVPLLDYSIPVVVVFDSLASMTPQEKFAKASENQGMRDKLALAAATSATFDVISSVAEMTNTAFVFLNQIREKPGVTHGDNTTTPGGKAPEFYASVRLRLARSTIYDEKLKMITGQKITCNVIKNKIWRPFGKANWDFMFQPDGTGKFEVVDGMIEELITLGKIERAGAWLTYNGAKMYKKELVAQVEEGGKEEYEKLVALFPTGPAGESLDV